MNTLSFHCVRFVGIIDFWPIFQSIFLISIRNLSCLALRRNYAVFQTRNMSITFELIVLQNEIPWYNVKQNMEMMVYREYRLKGYVESTKWWKKIISTILPNKTSNFFSFDWKTTVNILFLSLQQIKEKKKQFKNSNFHSHVHWMYSLVLWVVLSHFCREQHKRLINYIESK